ncbi:MAG TPA: amidohydrolase/deacetylase family metallohydrolase [Chryseosolibacter sp.]|nr:amidohydrolase/deacetylase family metallohydrolase [Chryseosolibacter sp.]
MKQNILLAFFLLVITTLTGHSQTLDLLIRNGHVIDPKNNIDGVMDVAIQGNKIVQVAKNISQDAKTVVDATGLYVTPGLIDLHGHHFFGTQPNAYLSNSFTALPPDGFTFRAGVTTVADAGGAGWKNFDLFKTNVIDRSRTRVLAFLNIVGAGMSGGAHEQNLADMDPKLAAMAARANKEYIVGIKLAHYEGSEWAPTERAVEAGKLAGIPVMVDFGRSEPPLPLRTLLMEKLRPGDILTHCYGGVSGREKVVENGKLQSWALEAQKRGIIFDVGHGGGSFLFAQAIPAIKQGLKPNSISTDLHTGSMNGGMKDMLNVMSKLLNIGLTLNEVITTSTWNPAQIISREELGNLSVGAPADVAVFSLDKGKFGFIDVDGYKITGDRKLTCQLTVRDGRVVWDLNGLAAKTYK